jgi:dGTPase
MRQIRKKIKEKTAERVRYEAPCPIRSAFQRDRDRIIHSKAFRRLKHKTQVFISPAGDHYRTRLTHTLEVSQIARTIARALGLNEDLTEAIALGHDLGHTPFGHSGEAVLNSLLKKYGMSFDHNIQSLHVADNIEKLNLTWEVRNGILSHPWTFPRAKTLEGTIVRYADRIAYINHDIDDSIRSGIIKKRDIPKRYIDFIGSNPVDAFVKDVIRNSLDKNIVSMSTRGESVLHGLYSFMFKKVYTSTASQIENIKVAHVLNSLFGYFMKTPAKVPGFKKGMKKRELVSLIRDYIAGMTDRFAVSMFTDLFVPSEWKT